MFISKKIYEKTYFEMLQEIEMELVKLYYIQDNILFYSQYPKKHFFKSFYLTQENKLEDPFSDILYNYGHNISKKIDIQIYTSKKLKNLPGTIYTDCIIPDNALLRIDQKGNIFVSEVLFKGVKQKKNNFKIE